MGIKMTHTSTHPYPCHTHFNLKLMESIIPRSQTTYCNHCDILGATRIFLYFISIMLKHRIKDRTAGLLLTQTRSSGADSEKGVTLTQEEWRKIHAFDRLIRQHLVQYNHLEIEKVAASIVRHWIANQGGRFMDISPSGDEHNLTDESTSVQKVAALISSIAVDASSRLVQRITPLSHVNRLPDDVISTSSPLNHSLGHIQEDEEPKTLEKEILLPMIPQDIFDQPMLPISPHKPPNVPPGLPRRVSLHRKPLEQHSELVTKLQSRGIPLKLSPTSKPCTDSRDAELLTPRTDNTSQRKTGPNNKTNKSQEKMKRATCDVTLLPLRKRFKRCVSFNSSTKLLQNPIASNLELGVVDKLSRVSTSTVQECDVNAFTSNDILFVGAWARDHGGNMLLKDWVNRFCKNIKGYSKIKFHAMQVVSLFQALSSRFLEPKVSFIDGSSIWVELQEQVVVERISVLIQNVLNKKNDGSVGMLLDLTFKVPTRIREVQILKIDVESSQTRPGNDTILLESSDFEHLGINDVILGKYDGRETHCGNLKFLHHMDAYMPKYERTMTVGGKLTLIRQMIGRWKAHVAATGRFLVGNGRVFSIVEADDELTMFLGVAGMVKEMTIPIPLGTSDIYLGGKWTIQRLHRRNLEYHRLLERNMKAYGVVAKVTTRDKRIVEELSIAGGIVRKMCWESYPNGPFKGGFKVFDTKVKDWVLVSVEEAVRRTLILLRLKQYFSVVAADNASNGLLPDCRADYAKKTLLQGSRSLAMLNCVSSSQSMLTEVASPVFFPKSERPIPSPMQITLLSSPKRSPNTSSLLQAELWSPTMTSPLAASPVKSFAVANSTQSTMFASVAHPVARHHVYQPSLVHRMPSYCPNTCNSMQYAGVIPTPTNHLSNENLLSPQFHDNRIQLPHPRNIGFWPSQTNNNEWPPPSHIHPTPVNNPSPFITPSRNDQLLWVPFSVPFNTN